MFDIARAVERGAKLLDRTRPGWWKEINPLALNMSSCLTCILGQLFGRYSKGMHTLSLYNMFTSRSHGFAIDTDSDYNDDWGRLRDAWMNEIEVRRSKG